MERLVCTQIPKPLKSLLGGWESGRLGVWDIQDHRGKLAVGVRVKWDFGDNQKFIVMLHTHNFIQRI